MTIVTKYIKYIINIVKIKYNNLYFPAKIDKILISEQKILLRKKKNRKKDWLNFGFDFHESIKIKIPFTSNFDESLIESMHDCVLSYTVRLKVCAYHGRIKC